MAMVMPRAFSSGALSIWSNDRNWEPPFMASTLVMAAVRVVLPWSTWPMVPTLTWGLLRSKTFLAIGVCSSSLACTRLGGDPRADLARHRLIVGELHRVRGTTLGHA